MVLFEAKFFVGLLQFNTDILSLHMINIPSPCFATCRSAWSRLWMFTRGRITKVWLDHDIRNDSTCKSWDHKVAAIMSCQRYFPNWSNLLHVSVQVRSRQRWWLAGWLNNTQLINLSRFNLEGSLQPGNSESTTTGASIHCHRTTVCILPASASTTFPFPTSHDAAERLFSNWKEELARC